MIKSGQSLKRYSWKYRFDFGMKRQLMRVTSSSFKKRRLSKKKLVRLKMSEIIFPRDGVSGKVEQNRFELKYFSRQEPRRCVCQLMVYFPEFLRVF